MVNTRWSVFYAKKARGMMAHTSLRTKWTQLKHDSVWYCRLLLRRRRVECERVGLQAWRAKTRRYWLMVVTLCGGHQPDRKEVMQRTAWGFLLNRWSNKLLLLSRFLFLRDFLLRDFLFSTAFCLSSFFGFFFLGYSRFLVCWAHTFNKALFDRFFGVTSNTFNHQLIVRFD